MYANYYQSRLVQAKATNDIVIKADLVDALSSAPVTFIHAPAGYGKTTLVHYWATHQPHRYTIINVVPWDNSASDFYQLFAYALANIDDAIAKQLLQLAAVQHSSTENAFEKAFIATLHQLDVKWTVILEDYHEISNATIHHFMESLLKHLPATLTIIITSRLSLPLKLSKMQMNSMVNLVSAKDLKLSLAEVEQLLAEQHDADVDTSYVESIYQMSEGWVAGALLLSESSAPNKHLSLPSNDHNHVYQFIQEEVLSQYDTKHLTFMIESSLFEQFSIDMCQQILGYAELDVITMIKSNTALDHFISKTSGTPTYYAYHQLLRYALKSCRTELSTHRLTEIYNRAADWYHVNQHYDLAIKYYLKAENYTAGADLMESIWFDMDQNLQSSTWLDYAKQLPYDLTLQRPIISLGYGWALLDKGDIKASQQWFKRAAKLYHQLNSNDDNPNSHADFSQIPIMLLNAKAYIAACQYRYQDLIDYNHQLKSHAHWESFKNTWVIDTFELTYHWACGNLDQAIDLLNHLIVKTKTIVSAIVYYSFKWLLAELLIHKGQLNEAQLTILPIIDIIKRRECSPMLGASLYLSLAKIAYIQAEYADVDAYVNQSMTLGYQYEFLNWSYNYQKLKAVQLIEQQDYEKAVSMLTAAERANFQNPMPVFTSTDDLILDIQLKNAPDQHALKQIITAELHQLLSRSSTLIDPTKENRLKTLLYHAVGANIPADARQIITALIKQAKVQSRKKDLIEWYIILSHYQTSEAKRQAYLKEAADLSDEEHIEQPFYTYGIRKSKRSPKSTSQLLSLREVEIIKLIENGYSNKQISNTLFIALSTVKSYNHEIFTKLGVKRRTQAVAKAKQLGII